ncbi:molybdopterin or thiamine biosynthesis adenylyltransferase [Yamadazyma tenuis]|uniref:Rhodanese domain-containing protein n=1 Tax=Candida tenuis (strain ATCC 10573 / BCRC 21748 / CBS 615 / JCM 9827 / NBRC 10315 / NRRL Y-1498 / VKM Y-70) TaxID=590646 RepID=G3B353_CANTC|nr:uncharacterized protein CANTEDRAFT_105638 [Yamadazyma tenuis ATCC 10573]EGV64082.1 hypothetical protein CANTEDRAFT_105638 [Yamadazyma tenuis ATCC 10573]WEJ96283.1 molybdopterin or thiamine biosynthesis adenylyltransferase [Yamadazyma tenuis]
MENLTKQELLERVATLQQENAVLRSLASAPEPSPSLSRQESIANLSLEEYMRYGRQMIVPEFGALESQLVLKRSKILVVGAGGLGCPALLYLTAAGVGEIGIVDNDIVDVSNLHRQVLHSTDTVGMLKCHSAAVMLARLNPHVTVKEYPIRLANDNVFEIFEKYDLILDCTDAPAVRYLVNDAAVILNKTVVSGSGLKTDGQWTILNFAGVGPCYRCFHPKPPAPDSVTSCQDGGVLGPAIGLIGINMALETIKVLTGHYKPEQFQPFMCAFYGYHFQQYRTFKMRGRQKSCQVCGEQPTVTRTLIERGELNYQVFCGRSEPYTLPNELRVSVEEYHQNGGTLIDVRPAEQFSVVALPNSVNIPWGNEFLKLESLESYLPGVPKDKAIFVVCRYGNDSQIATKTIREKFGFTNVRDIKGGLNRWSEEVDKDFPKY